MTPDSQSLHKLVEEIHQCKTQKRAIELAAELVLLFTNGPYRVDKLGTNSGTHCQHTHQSPPPVEETRGNR